MLQINPCIYSQLIFDAGAKNTQWGKNSLFNKWSWESWIISCKRMKLDPILCHPQKITWNGLKTLNEKPETVKLLEESIGKKIFLDFFWIEHQKHKQQNQKSTSRTTSTKKLLHRRRNNRQMKRKPVEWEKIFANHISDQGLISKMYKELI